MQHVLRSFVLFAALFVVAALPALAQRSGQTLKAFEGVGMEERLGEQVAAGATFFDESGRPVEIGSYLKGEKPVLLTMVYHNCPMLCNMVLTGLTESLKGLAWTPGEEFDVVAVSFAPDETPDLAARQKDRYLEELGRPEAASGYHFLTGSEASIQALAASIGFQFKWMEENQEYAHPAALVFLSPSGKISRYLYGVEFDPSDMRKALVEAGEGKVGTPMDKVFFFCYRYDEETNAYVPYAMNLMKLGGVLTLLALAAVLCVFWRRERHKQSIHPHLGGTPATWP